MANAILFICGTLAFMVVGLAVLLAAIPFLDMLSIYIGSKRLAKIVDRWGICHITSTPKKTMRSS